MATWLKDINLLELSPVKRPANKKRAILRKSEDIMIVDNLAERLEKAELGEDQKQAVMAALDALEMAREGMDPEAFDAAMSALASLLMPEVPSGEPMDEDADEGPTPDMEEPEEAEDEKAEEEPAPESNPEPEGEGDPEPDPEEEEKGDGEMKKSEDFEALLKAREDELAELRKSLADRDEEIKAKTYQEKAEAFGNVPMAVDELAGLLRLVDESGVEGAPESLGRLLSGIGEITVKSEAFTELGGSGDSAADRSGVMGKIDALADAMVQKSESNLTREQAVARVLEANPALYTEWVNKG